jgi:hypothetical protein
MQRKSRDKKKRKNKKGVRKKNAWKNGVVDLTADYITTSKSSDKPVMFCFMRGASFLLSVGRLISVVGYQKCEGHTKWKCLPVMFCPSLYLHLSQTNTDMLSQPSVFDYRGVTDLIGTQEGPTQHRTNRYLDCESLAAYVTLIQYADDFNHIPNSHVIIIAWAAI